MNETWKAIIAALGGFGGGYLQGKQQREGREREDAWLKLKEDLMRGQEEQRRIKAVTDAANQRTQADALRRAQFQEELAETERRTRSAELAGTSPVPGWMYDADGNLVRDYSYAPPESVQDRSLTPFQRMGAIERGWEQPSPDSSAILPTGDPAPTVDGLAWYGQPQGQQQAPGYDVSDAFRAAGYAFPANPFDLEDTYGEGATRIGLMQQHFPGLLEQTGFVGAGADTSVPGGQEPAQIVAQIAREEGAPLNESELAYFVDMYLAKGAAHVRQTMQNRLSAGG